jgi:hypothetical protein
MKTIVLIRRGDTLKPDLVLLDGELAFTKSDRLFYVGDGTTPMSDLKPFSSLVAGENGQIYTVRVDADGNAHAKPVKEFYRGCEYEFKISE